MSQFRFETAKIVGSSSQKYWSQVHTFLPAQTAKLEKRGQLLALISLQKTAGEGEIIVLGHEIISRLHEEYYGKLSDSILGRLKKAVKKVKEEIPDGFAVEIVAAALGNRALFLVIAGEGKVFLRRGDDFGMISQGEPDGTVSSSGYLEKDDLLFFGTSSLFKSLAEGAVKAALGASSAQEAAEAIAPVVYGQSLAGAPVGAVAKVARFDSAEIKKEDQEEARDDETRQENKWLLKLEKLLAWGQKLVFSFWLLIAGKIKSKPALGKLQPKKPRRFKPALLIALVTSFLLIISVVWGVRQKKAAFWRQEREQAFAQITLKLEEAEALVDLNPIRARQLLDEVWAQLTDLEGKEDEEQIQKLETAYQIILSLVLKEHKLGELPVFFDLEIIKEGGQGKKLGLLKDELVVLDSKNRALYGIETKSKKGWVLAGGSQLEGASQLALSETKIFILSSQGILAGETGEDLEIVVEEDSDWNQINGLAAYGGNLYLLDQGSQALYRYPAIEEGFGTKQSWLKEETGLLAHTVSLAIDGSIWLLKQDGEIAKLTHGFIDPFGLAGLDQALSKPKQLYTDPKQENLYVLDQENKRLVVFAKDGEYQAQYLWSNTGLIEAMAVSEEKGKIWLLEKNKIYQIELK